MSYDDYGTRYIGPQQITANLSLNSFVGSGDQTAFTVTKTPRGGELTYTDVNYSTPITDDGDRWQLGYTRVHTHPLFVLRPAQIDGLNDNYYTTFTFPIIRERTRSLTMRTGFNYLDSVVTTFSQPLYADHIRSLDIGGTYNWSDTWQGSNLFSADFRQGLPILGYTSNQNPQTAQTSRPGARGDYTKIDATFSRLQVIQGPLSIYAIAMGQWAFNPVLAAEQFTFGGSQMGRGYDVAELIGDKGLAGSLELRYDVTFSRFIQNLQFYAFYDAGEVWDFKFLGGVPRKVTATSTGAGMRFFFTRAISGNVMWTQPLTKPVAAEQLIGDGRRPRVFFSVVASLD
jgi:hemolysin activation/secretion protein